ncbi:hypothetical protein [Caldimonas tepidiphila]|uniref:hypothetical protein n=1 Tax=Caldimonas tepidiphila TaxID=2315841 RepID=UPI000E5A4831|nr:hypothetical protein [Caldimonas tepidiphila]
MDLTAVAASPALNENTLHRVRSLNAADGVGELGLYRDSPRRRSMRELLEASASTGATVTIEYYKKDFSPRVMRCRVRPGEDRTCRYVTVWDLQAAGYRRVCLDNVVRITVDPLI